MTGCAQILGLDISGTSDEDASRTSEPSDASALGPGGGGNGTGGDAAAGNGTGGDSAASDARDADGAHVSTRDALADGDADIPDAAPPADREDADADRDGDTAAPPCSADFHALPLSEFPPCSEYWTARELRPRTLSISPDGRRISGSFQSGTPIETRFRYDMTALEFDEELQQAVAANFLVKDWSIYRIGGDVDAGAPDDLKRYAAIFEPSGAFGVYTVREVPAPEFGELWNSLFFEGFMQTDGFAHVYDGSDLSVSGSWVKPATFSDYPFRYFEEPSFYAAENSYFVQNSNLRVSHCQGYVGPGAPDIDYVALWEPAGENRFVSFSNSSTEYAHNYARIKAHGYVLRKVNMHGFDSYSAIWVGPHDLCEAGEKLLAESDPCVPAVCQTEPSCCAEAWSELCVDYVRNLCGRCTNAGP